MIEGYDLVRIEGCGLGSGLRVSDQTARAAKCGLIEDCEQNEDYELTTKPFAGVSSIRNPQLVRSPDYCVSPHPSAVKSAILTHRPKAASSFS